MFERSEVLFIYVETPLHAGTGRGLGTVDLPIQRERTTGYPMVQASSVKGRLRAECANPKMEVAEHLAVFGPETVEADKYAGALSTGDARILLFPVRSVAGVFAWATSLDVLARFKRELASAGISTDWDLPTAPPAEDHAFVNGGKLLAGDALVLEEFAFTPDGSNADTVRKIGEWLAAHALADTPEYAYWRGALPEKLCILPEDSFRDFVMYGTEVQTHIKLNSATKTVDKEKGALWTSESLPVDTLLYAPLMATKSRSEVTMGAKDILNKLRNALPKRIQLGGDETTGQGVVSLRIEEGE